MGSWVVSRRERFASQDRSETPRERAGAQEQSREIPRAAPILRFWLARKALPQNETARTLEVALALRQDFA